ncbi:MAG: DUF4245 domain-containing protein [Propioniciclava sp.]
MARSARLSSTSTHMIVAMLVLLVPVIGITVLFTREPAPTIPDIPYPVAAERAAAQAEFVLRTPSELPDGWVCTKADWLPAGTPGRAEPVVGDTWTMAFLTPEQMYIGLDQRVAAPERFIDQRTRDGVPDGTAQVAGESWVRYLSADGVTRSLVSSGDVVTVVSGDLPYADLEAFVGLLVPVA